MEKKISESKSSEASLRILMARVHCDTCKGRFVTEIKIQGIVKKDVKSETLCRTCKKEGMTSYLLFDRAY